MAPASPAGSVPPRLLFIDIFRGLAMIIVVMHHTMGQTLRYIDDTSALHMVIAWVNRSQHFVIPGFLFLTAMLITRSMMRRFDGRDYFGKRFRYTLIPYLLWTLLFLLYQVATLQRPPTDLLDLERWVFWLQYGKGHFHLYFLVVALQFYLALPLLRPLALRLAGKGSSAWFWAVFAAATALQVGIYYLNRGDTLNFRFPATLIWWYMPALILGVYFGANFERFEAIWRRNRLPWLLISAVALFVLLPPAYGALLGQNVNTAAYQVGSIFYQAAAMLLMLGVSAALTRAPQWVWAPLSALGAMSLQIYLLHPLVLHTVERAGYGFRMLHQGLAFTAYFLLALLLPFLIGRLLNRTRLGPILFGR